MIKYLFDTNIVSELTRPHSDSKVIEFVTAQQAIHISTITIHELNYGLLLLPEGKRKANIHNIIEQFINKYDQFITSIRREEAERAASFRAEKKGKGEHISLADSLIAATAYNHSLTLVTRNIKDFKKLPIEVYNPFPEPH